MIRSYRDLDVWRRGVLASLAMYKVTATFPPEERFGLTHQLRKASVSVPSNVAEGHERHGRKDYLAKVNVARGEVAEIETQLIIARGLGYSTKPKLRALLKEYEGIGRSLTNLARKLKSDPDDQA